jgi:hypothetical protein
MTPEYIMMLPHKTLLMIDLRFITINATTMPAKAAHINYLLSVIKTLYAQPVAVKNIYSSTAGNRINSSFGNKQILYVSPYHGS